MRAVLTRAVCRYWDWTRDSSNMAGSEMFHPVRGLGGNGKSTVLSNGYVYNCVQDGPYGVQANFSVRKFRCSSVLFHPLMRV